MIHTSLKTQNMHNIKIGTEIEAYTFTQEGKKGQLRPDQQQLT